MNAVFFLLFSWGMVRARTRHQVLALALVGVTGAAIVAQPSITYAQGMIGAIESVLNLINGDIHTALNGINSVRTAMSNLYQVVAFPTQLINQARAQVTGITNQFRYPMRSMFNISLTSATLPETQALESVMRNGQIGDFNTLTSNYHSVFGLPLSSTAASPQDQMMVDMDDALAKDNLKTLKEIDAAGQTMLQAADQIEDTTSTAAPGSAPFLTATAVATSIQNQALTQKMIAAELRQVAGRLAHSNALRKRGTTYTNQFGGSIQQMLQPR
jgi:hypothetical protein